jgi:hypothetical protein
VCVCVCVCVCCGSGGGECEWGGGSSHLRDRGVVLANDTGWHELVCCERARLIKQAVSHLLERTEASSERDSVKCVDQRDQRDESHLSSEQECQARACVRAMKTARVMKVPEPQERSKRRE